MSPMSDGTEQSRVCWNVPQGSHKSGHKSADVEREICFPSLKEIESGGA
jgi:hypothetical protein